MSKNLQCGTCKHWCKLEKPKELGPDLTLRTNDKPFGECRQSPPVPQLIIQPTGAQALASYYPLLPDTFLACAQHQEALKLEEGIVK